MINLMTIFVPIVFIYFQKNNYHEEIICNFDYGAVRCCIQQF